MITRRMFLSGGLFSAGVAAGGLTAWVSTRPRTRRPAFAVPGTMDAHLALSLAQYQPELQAAWKAGPVLPEALRTFHGLNRITGILRTDDGDTLLLGDHDNGIPALELDDWLVALRNAYGAGPEYEGAIGCTIDPVPGAADPWRIQDAKVFGMPPTAKMGARHVAIDYELKKVAAGLLALQPRIQSVYELARSGSAPCEATGQDAGTRSATHRFWFTPRYPASRPRFVEDRHAIWIRHPILVQVQSEEEFLQAGKRVSAGPPHPAAVRFTESVTGLLATDDVARYTRLRNDFRVIEVARVMRFKGVPAQRLRYLLHERPLEVVAAPSKVGGIRREESGEAVCDAQVVVRRGPGGSRTEMSENVVRYRHEFRGGVEARVELSAGDFGGDADSTLARLTERVLNSRPHEGGAVWEIRT